MQFYNCKALAGNSEAQAIFDSINAEVQKLNADQERHRGVADGLKAKNPDLLTVQDIETGKSLQLESFQLARRELAIRRRIRDEWQPLLLPARIRMKHDRLEKAIATEPVVIEKIRSALLEIGYMHSQAEAAFFNAAINAHPDVRAIRKEMEEAGADLNTREPDHAMEMNNSQILTLESTIADRRKTLLSV